MSNEVYPMLQRRSLYPNFKLFLSYSAIKAKNNIQTFFHVCRLCYILNIIEHNLNFILMNSMDSL